jgi:SAM-dependent methyltransferase
MSGMSAAGRWSDTLAGWAIPQEILDVAPESPWGFPTCSFAHAARDALAGPLSLTHQRARDALPARGGVVLDVGAGAGAASLPLAPPAGRIVAVDESAAMLDELARLARGRVAVELIEGRWPDVGERVAPVDVVVCAHVVYNVTALGEFLTALHARARRRVVVEFTAVHPQAVLSPLWRHFWGLDRPSLPTADDALAVMREVIPVPVHVQYWVGRHPLCGRGDDTEIIASIRRRLCLPASADDEIRQLVNTTKPMAPTLIATAWWP